MRLGPTSTVLPSGKVLLTGGSAVENKLVDTAQTAETWDPNTRQFRRLATAATSASISIVPHKIAENSATAVVSPTSLRAKKEEKSKRPLPSAKY